MCFRCPIWKEKKALKFGTFVRGARTHKHTWNGSCLSLRNNYISKWKAIFTNPHVLFAWLLSSRMRNCQSQDYWMKETFNIIDWCDLQDWQTTTLTYSNTWWHFWWNNIGLHSTLGPMKKMRAILIITVRQINRWSTKIKINKWKLYSSVECIWQRKNPSTNSRQLN